MLSDVDRQRYTELLAAYVGETAGHYVHWVKGYAATEIQLQPAGQALYELMRVMAADYGQDPTYQVAARLFAEQFRVVAEAAQAKANQEISASSLR